MSTLITGASGYIGSAVVRELLRGGESVRCLIHRDRSRRHLNGLDIDIVRGDIRDIDSLRRAVRGCRKVYHLAALYANWLRRPGRIYQINEDGTRNVMTACREAAVERVVYCSSVAALGAHGRTPADESAGFNLNATGDHYYISKFRAEQIVRQYIRSGLPAVIVNPSNPIGAGDREPTPTGALILNILKKRLPAYVEGGINLIDLGDCARGILAAMDRGKIGENYILGNRNVGIKEYFDLIVKVAGRGLSPPIRMPSWLAVASAYGYEALAWVTGKAPITSSSWVRVGSHYSWWDCQKAREYLGLGQRPIEDSLAEAVAWFEQNGYL